MRRHAPALATFALAWLAFTTVFASFPFLYDTDSYYHLAVGRLYANAGVVDVMPWARFSVLYDGFGDKELLFHLLLAPFAAGEHPGTGGRLALGFLNALTLVLLGAVGVRAAGRWGLLVPVLLWGGSTDFFGRLARLRPETPALLLFLAAALCAGRGRHRLLGVVAFVFALSYTAIHALLGLCLAWFLWLGWRLRRWPWLLLAYPFLGAGLGLLLHPHFPHNLLVWKIQSIDFFQYRHVLDVGDEIEAATTSDLLKANLGWLCGLVLIAWAGISRRLGGGEPRAAEPPDAEGSFRAVADTLAIAALAFGGLLILGRRFVTFALPFLLLAVLYQLRAAGLLPGRRLALPRRRDGGSGSVPAWPLVTVLLIGCAWSTVSFVDLLAHQHSTPVPREVEWTAFGQHVPPGARVAAFWGDTHIFALYAPQGMYLNVLDPVFMAVPYPEVYRTQRQLLEGHDPDVPFTLVSALDSEFLALSRFHQHRRIFERLRHDPRLRVVHEAYTLLFRVIPDATGDFVVDWRAVPAGGVLPVAADAPVDGWSPYPLTDDAVARRVEAYVDLRRLLDPAEAAGAAAEDPEPLAGDDRAVEAESPQPPGPRCQALVRDEETAVAETRRYELAPWGPTTIWLDGRVVAEVRGTLRAYLGRGARFAVDLEPGRHRWTVVSCRGEGMGDPIPDQMGFYLRRLGPPSPSPPPIG